TRRRGQRNARCYEGRPDREDQGFHWILPSAAVICRDLVLPYGLASRADASTGNRTCSFRSKSVIASFLPPYRPERRLRAGFFVGAITDALALVPMLCPPVARLVWGFDVPSGPYRFAMGYGASLMLGWTLLLLWARARPLERRFVAALTVVV